VTVVAVVLPLNTKQSCAEPFRSRVFVAMETNVDLPMEVINSLPNRLTPTKRRSVMAFGIMGAAAMERDASLAMIKEDGKMLHACLALRLIASMSLKAREDLNL